MQTNKQKSRQNSASIHDVKSKPEIDKSFLAPNKGLCQKLYSKQFTYW